MADRRGKLAEIALGVLAAAAIPVLVAGFRVYFGLQAAQADIAAIQEQQAAARGAVTRFLREYERKEQADQDIN